MTQTNAQTLTMENTMFNSINFKKILLLSFFTLFTAVFSFGGVTSANAATWENQSIKVKGEWSIQKRADGNYLVLNEKFKTKNAPDLKFFLSKNPATNVTGKNATDNAVQIAVLSSNKGEQSYKIPSNINIADYDTLILHCEQYSKLWAATPLK